MSESGGIVVLDFGGQYTQLIARRIREQQVFSAILPCTAGIEQIRKFEPVGIVLSGGPNSVYDQGAPPCDAAVLTMGAAGTGNLLRLAVDGAHPRRACGARRPPGVRAATELQVKDGSPLFEGIPRKLRIWNSHGDHVRALPFGFHVTGETGNAVSAAEDPVRQIFTPCSFIPKCGTPIAASEILRNFVFNICHAKPLWSGAAFIAETVESIRKQVGDSRAICALSGGVDSAVAAALVHQGDGRPPYQYFRDNGVLRKNEFRDTLELLRDRMGLQVIGVDASERFLEQTEGRDRSGDQAQAHRRGIHRRV